MNFKTTNILIVVLAVVLGIVYFVGKGSSPSEQTTAPQKADTAGRKLLDVESGHITRLVISNSAGERTTLQKTVSKWSLTSPVNAPAVEWSVTPLLTTISDLRSQGRPSADVSSEAG